MFRQRSVARNPSPDRNPGPQPDSYRHYERQRFDGPDTDYRHGGDRFAAPAPEFRQRDFRPPDFRPKREDMRQTPGPRNVFDRSAYPAKGTTRAEDTRSLPAVYELPKIQKKVKGEEELNEAPEEKIVRLRVEHAKLEMRIQSLEKVVESANAREAEIRRQCNGALADNSKFSDTIKLLNDAKRQLEAARQEYSFKDDIIKKLMQKPAEKSSSDNNSNNKPPEKVQILATDFLNEKREERVEETDVSSKLEFYDGADHWCQQCNFFATTVSEHLSHLQSADHWAKNKSNASAPWPLVKRASNFDQDRSLAAIKGSQFMIPCHGFYCAICKLFLGDSEAGEEHLFSISHNKMVQRFFLSKPEYEHLFNKDRMSAKSKADAEARKQKREAEDRRLREEEAKRKAHEEETRKKEMEIRERLTEENKHIKRMRELEDKKEKEKLRKEREKRQEKERERDRKRSRIVRSLSSDDDDDSVSEVVESPPDPKLQMSCSVIISADEYQAVLDLFLKQNRTVQSGKHLYSASSTDPATAVWSKVGRTDKPVATVTQTPVITVEFNDDSNEEFSLDTVRAISQDKDSPAASTSVTDILMETDEKPKNQTTESGDVPSVKERHGPKSPDKKADSPMEELILNALTDCLTPPVVGEEDAPPAKKHKKTRENRVEVITGDDPDDDDGGAAVDADAGPAADPDDGLFPNLSLDDLVTKSP